MIGQLAEFRRFAGEHKLPWRVWSGEVGFSSFRLDDPSAPGFYSPCTPLEQAQYLVRMMVVQLARGVRRIFWYDFRNDGWEPNNPEHNMGLVRSDNAPKPAIVAYACLIHRLRGCRWLGAYAIGGGDDAYAFVAEQTGRPVLIAWARKGTRTEPLQVPSGVREVTVTDIFGASTKRTVKEHRLELDLTGVPVYVDGLAMEDVRPFVTPSAPGG